MSTLTVNLPKDDAKRLAEIAARKGVTIEEAAAQAVKAQLDADAASRKEVEAGLAELDAGEEISFEAFELEMDAFMKDLRAERG